METIIDTKSNILNIRFSKKKSIDSEVKDNVVIDYDENGEIVNLEIMKIDLREFAEFAKANQSVLEFAVWSWDKIEFVVLKGSDPFNGCWRFANKKGGDVLFRRSGFNRQYQTIKNRVAQDWRDFWIC